MSMWPDWMRGKRQLEESLRLEELKMQMDMEQKRTMIKPVPNLLSVFPKQKELDFNKLYGVGNIYGPGSWNLGGTTYLLDNHTITTGI